MHVCMYVCLIHIYILLCCFAHLVQGVGVEEESCTGTAVRLEAGPDQKRSATYVSKELLMPVLRGSSLDVLL